MNQYFLARVIKEISPVIVGRRLSKISAAGNQLALDFGLSAKRLLLVSFDASAPAIYLSSKTRHSQNVVTPFLLHAKKELVGKRLASLGLSPKDRVITCEFPADGADSIWRLVLALTGRTSNAYLIADNDIVTADLTGRGCRAGETLTILPIESALAPQPDHSLTADVMATSYLSGGYGFDPQLKAEFLARCEQTDPLSALRSLRFDLEEAETLPIVYSAIPLERIGAVPVKAQSDLLLSHFEMSQASTMYRSQFPSLSEAAAAYYAARSKALGFQSKLEALKRRLKSEIKNRHRTASAIDSDILRLGNPEDFKQYGDLLLANIATGTIEGSMARLKDYFAAGEPEITLEIGTCGSFQAAAASYYRRYQKAKRGIELLEPRRRALIKQVGALTALLETLEADPSLVTIGRVTEQADHLLGKTPRQVFSAPADKKLRDKSLQKVGRRFISSDGYEIVIGRNDKENDSITFRLAGSHELWLHAADYPGSHVVVRSPRGTELPQRTILEAAELAAFFSQAKNESKAAVHYTLRKFVSKPPRAAPGLVRLSSFKTLMVTPKCSVQKKN